MRVIVYMKRVETHDGLMAELHNVLIQMERWPLQYPSCTKMSNTGSQKHCKNLSRRKNITLSPNTLSCSQGLNFTVAGSSAKPFVRLLFSSVTEQETDPWEVFYLHKQTLSRLLSGYPISSSRITTTRWIQPNWFSLRLRWSLAWDLRALGAGQIINRAFRQVR